MKTSLMILGLAVAVAMLVVTALPAAEAPVAGTKAPDFTLKSQEGKNVSLHDFKGKWVVLYFYPRISPRAAPLKRTTSRPTRTSTPR